MPSLVDCEAALTDADIHAFRSRFGSAVPDALIAHYRQFNGGSPAEEDVEAGRWGLPVHGFNAIKHGVLCIEQLAQDMDSIVPDDEQYGTWAAGEFLPFAFDAGGNSFFISLRDQDAGTVYLYAPGGEDIFYISASFQEFRDQLFDGEQG
ncbi:SMI1/KNR4 family protein [Pigmentiphaga aceris]|uniref:SMI1/KNR4 family protein n=1 Tax=Pigmentiphaga aceris TaxID=1940612 RepID=A0A5C0AX99_9BURK|nr:SMI1/KNR4 family protein [Pigmentiphaga aceris]QEI06755.1 SMI1/KNR4 family protein [Pigmentiphaga aceris]